MFEGHVRVPSNPTWDTHNDVHSCGDREDRGGGTKTIRNRSNSIALIVMTQILTHPFHRRDSK